ncbi:uncharacterized protein LOC130957082 [Arachis stenosperma]|uniref:uncharacterized protein LOC130957082 n=1 Tax=Arachis stenosperma TaxID=217475 RepID=UPI0025AC332B|nr:uncharacterized protein LOC130957082 [Arachis stenosperma]
MVWGLGHMMDMDHKKVLGMEMLVRVVESYVVGVNHDTWKLSLFPFSLRDEAAQWLETMPQGSITSWDELVTKFLTKFASSQQNIKMKEGIQPFIQGEEESLFKPRERYKEANDKEGFRAFYEGLTPETRRAVDYVLDNLFKATSNAQGIAKFNDKKANNQHSSEIPQNATPEKEIMNPEGMKIVMNQSKQLHNQTQSQLESISRQIDFLHSAAVKAQFPPWKPHSYLGMKESQCQEQRDFNYNNQSHSSMPQYQSQNDVYIPPWRIQSNWKEGESQTQKPRDFNCNNPNFKNQHTNHPHNNNHQALPQHTHLQPQPTSPFAQNNSYQPPQLTQPQPFPTAPGIYVLETLMERFMKIQEIMAIEQEEIKKHQEMISKNQETVLRRLERQMEQLVQNLAELNERKGTLNPKSHEKEARLKEKEVVEECKKSQLP